MTKTERDELRRLALNPAVWNGCYFPDKTVLALLDAADERDLLAALRITVSPAGWTLANLNAIIEEKNNAIRENYKLRVERDQLLAVLKTIAEYGEADGGPFALSAAKTARAAIAKTTRGS